MACRCEMSVARRRCTTAGRGCYVGAMTRRSLFLMAVAAAGCGGGAKKDGLAAMPGTVGGWRLKGTEKAAPGEAAEPARSLNPKQWVKAEYENGQQTVAVQAFVFGVDAQAFEMQQKWRRGGGDVTFYKKTVFVVCASEKAGVKELVEFARELEKLWP